VLEALTTLSRQVLDRVSLRDDSTEAAMTAPERFSKIERPEPIEQSTISRQIRAQSEDAPQVTLLSHEVSADGGTIRIPLTIGSGEGLRRLVVTVHVDLE
jgi:hypothetical protein